MIEYKVKVYENGAKYWYLNDQRHREDGPAIEWANGTKKWFLNGTEVTEEEVMGTKDNKPQAIKIDGVRYVREN